MSQKRWVGLLVAVVAMLVVACTNAASPSDLSTTSTPGQNETSTPAPDSAPPFEPAPIDDWQTCGPGAQCGSLSVPLDYTKPDGPKISLALKRLPATDPSARIGSLFVNPGGPGASGVDSVADIAGSLGSDVRASFDVVSWDPRGIGGSEPLDCESSVLPFFEQDLGQVPAGPQAEKQAQAVADACEKSNGDLLPFVGTIDVARDLESLRLAVGDDKLNYAGFSYGTEIGLVYAELFPTHIRAMLLDGVVDPTQSASEMIVSQSKAVDDVLAKFVTYCDAKASCKAPPDTATAITEVMAASRTDPQQARIMGQQVPFGPTFANFGITIATYDKASWNTLGLALQAAQRGNVAALASLSNAYLTGASMTANLAVSCLDSPIPTGDDFTKMAQAAADVAPITGSFNANTSLPCAFWPTPPKPVPTSYQAAGSPPIQVWGTTGDNATPYANAVKIAGMLENGHLATLEADRHASVGANDCVIDAQAKYLISLVVAPAGTRC